MYINQFAVFNLQYFKLQLDSSIVEISSQLYSIILTSAVKIYMIKLFIVILVLQELTILGQIPRSNPTLSGYHIIESPDSNHLFRSIDLILKNKHQQLINALPSLVQATNSFLAWRISYKDPQDATNYFISEGNYAPIRNQYQEISWFMVSYFPNFERNNNMTKDKKYAPQQIVKNTQNDKTKMNILYYLPAYGQVINLKIPKNSYFFNPDGQPKVTTDLSAQFQKFGEKARILQEVQSNHLDLVMMKQQKNARILQQTTSSTVRPINISQFLVNLPFGSVIQSVSTPPSPHKMYSQLFDKFNSQIRSELKRQNINFSQFPPFPDDGSSTLTPSNSSNLTSNQIQNNTISDSSKLPDIVPARPLELSPTYIITPNQSSLSSSQVQIITVPQQNTSNNYQAKPLDNQTTIITSDFYSKPMPKIDSKVSIINAFRNLQLGNSDYYRIQQVDYNRDPNLLGVISQLKEDKKSEMNGMLPIYAQFFYLPKENITNYNIIFKNQTRYIATAIRFPYKILNYNILAPTQINYLCNSFDNRGNCLNCSDRSYFSVYKICIGVNPLCQNYNNLTGACTSCYGGYQLSSEQCIKSGSQDFDVGCNNLVDSVCVSCSTRYYLSNGKCIAISDFCQTWDTKSGVCLSCYLGYSLLNGRCVN